jgi:arsenate reductase
MLRVLFLCTHNRCRSIICEAVARQLASDRIQAFSAGSQPEGQVHPLSLKYLQQAGLETSDLRSESWDDYQDAAINLVITVCDSAAHEACPLWMGEVEKQHWGMVDPSRVAGSDEEVAVAFRATIAEATQRIEQLISAL